jgi:hypothetical protein
MDQVNGQKKWELFLEGTKYQVQDLMYVHKICNRIYPSVMAKGMDHVTEQKNWELFPEGTKYQVRDLMQVHRIYNRADKYGLLK